MAGYFWPTIKKDAAQFVRRCDKCQQHGLLIHQASADLTIITSPCPFASWGIDFVGSFPTASGSYKFQIVAIDYFAKWVEAELGSRITDQAVMKFIWFNICCKHSVPRNLISDNGTQFNSARMQKLCERM